jgi:hypothetical protein
MGIITGVIMHLIRCIDSTPLIVPAHVKESMALLRMRETQQTFGWMVLHNLNIQGSLGSDEDEAYGDGTDGINMLEEVQDKDDLDVSKSLGIGLNNSRRRRTQRRPGEAPSDLYPLGTTPTWTELTKAIQEKPWEIMRQWRFNSSWTASATAGKLFVQFSRQIWLLLHPIWTGGQDGASNTLEQAMESWAVAEVYNKLASIRFLPCNSKLKGAPRGRPEKSFRERFKMYFPDAKPPKSSQWLLFWEPPGYIGEYRRILHDMDNDEDAVENLIADIQELFDHIQCLPNSQGYTTSTGGRVWSKFSGGNVDGIEVVTNPLDYKLVEVGTVPGRRSQGTRKSAARTKKAFTKALLEQEGYGENTVKRVLAQDRKKRRSTNNRKSVRSKAYRVPPIRKQSFQKKQIGEVEDSGAEPEKTAEKDDDEEEEEEEDNDDDEDEEEEEDNDDDEEEDDDDDDDEGEYMYDSEGSDDEWTS